MLSSMISWPNAYAALKEQKWIVLTNICQKFAANSAGAQAFKRGVSITFSFLTPRFRQLVR